MDKNVLEMLSQTDKGRLRYGSSRQSKCIEDGRLFIPFNPGVFDIKEFSVVLENCQESAIAEEESHVEEQLSKTFLSNLTQINEENKEDRNKPISIISTRKDLQILANDNLDKQSREVSVSSKTRLYEKTTDLFSKNAKEKYLRLKEEKLQRNAAEREKLERHTIENKKREDEIKKQSREDHESRNKIRLTRIEEAANRSKLRKKQGRERLQSANLIIHKMKLFYDDLLSEINHQKNQPLRNLPFIESYRSKVAAVHISSIELVKRCEGKAIMEQVELDNLSSTLSSLSQSSVPFFSTLEKFRLEQVEKERNRQEQIKLEKEEEEKAKKILLAEKEKELANRNPENLCPSLPKEYALSVCRAAYHSHIQLQTLLHQYEDIKKRFVSDKTNMKVVMAINKAIMVPISSITSRSGSDVKNKLNDLNNVLKGVNIKVNNQTVQLSDDALAYACLCVAQKFVKQAEGQVSANHSAAFCLALVVVGIWSSNEVFGKLFLAQLESKCPFVIPWYIPRQEKQSDEEYNKLRGYLYDDETGVEKQDKYLSRMSGLIRMYAAVIQSPLPPGVRKHPHGVAEGWKWVSRMLNLDPWPDVTATVLFDFLHVSGHILMKLYGKQSEKILYSLCHDYFPKIEEVTDGGGGPVQRLQMFLKDCIKKKEVEKPEGYLNDGFWNTYHHTGVVGS